MKKTKIICTMGPNTNDKSLLKTLFLNGMNVARFNFSHGDHEEHLGRLNLINELRKETGIEVATLLDTKGPEIRTGKLKDSKSVVLKEGETYILCTDEIVGDEKKGYISYAGIINDISVGNSLLIDDGLIELKVEKIEGTCLYCKIINGGTLGEKKGVNIPGVTTNLPHITQKDKDDILFGIKHGFDFIAASFVRNADAIKDIRKILDDNKSNMKIIAKIENREGVDNIDSIIDVADGIMVARGDMGVEIPEEEVPFIQKTIVRKCNNACKPVIIATQMLDSMMRNPRPTRAEVTDVANAVYDGADVVMLSGEVAAGKYPLESLVTMAKIVMETEKHLDLRAFRRNRLIYLSERNISNQIASAAVNTADELGAKCIIAPSISGFTLRILSKWRPNVITFGLSPDKSSLRQMQLYWGVYPMKAKRAASTDDLIRESLEMVKKKGHVESGDLIVVTAGIISDKSSNIKPAHTNTLRIEYIQ